MLHIAIHESEAARGGGFLHGLDLFVVEVGDEGAGVGGGREDIDIGEALGQGLVALDADHAAHEVDGEIGVGGLERFEGAEAADGFVFGALAHDAGVEDDDLSVFGTGGGLIALLFEGRGDALGVGDVHLAAFGPDVVVHRLAIIPIGFVLPRGYFADPQWIALLRSQ